MAAAQSSRRRWCAPCHCCGCQQAVVAADCSGPNLSLSLVLLLCWSIISCCPGHMFLQRQACSSCVPLLSSLCLNLVYSGKLCLSINPAASECIFLSQVPMKKLRAPWPPSSAELPWHFIPVCGDFAGSHGTHVSRDTLWCRAQHCTKVKVRSVWAVTLIPKAGSYQRLKSGLFDNTYFPLAMLTALIIFWRFNSLLLKSHISDSHYFARGLMLC